MIQQQRIVLATGNPGKVREINQLLAGFAMEIIPQSEFAVTDVAETGETFVENAIIKARHASALTGHPTIADDSGLEVDALNGAPGITSSRYAGSDSDSKDQANLEKLLARLANVPTNRRSARFQCVLVYLRNPKDPTPLICQGTWEGVILDSPQGTNGFGYDPIFYVPDQHCTAAELSPEVKNRLSHRGQALQHLLTAFSQ